MKKISPYRKMLLSCAGVDIPTMAQCTSAEAKKYCLIGLCVLIPTVLALITGGYSVHKISGSLTASIIIAPIWAWVIFTLDRAIVANTNSSKFTSKFLGRILLAFFISVLISQPVELLVFRDVIIEKRNIDLQERRDESISSIDAEIESLSDEIKEIDKGVTARRNEYIEEVTQGNSRLGRRAGVGPVARELNKQLGIDSLKAEGDKQLLKDNISELEREKSRRLSNVTDAYPEGLLGDLELLYSIAKENRTVKLASVFFFLFFLILELIPIIIKVGSMDAEGDLYTKVKKRDEENCISAIDNKKSKRTELYEKEQMLLLAQRVQRIDVEIEKENLKESSKNHHFYIKTVKSTSDEINAIESEIARKIKNEAVREHLLAQVLEVYFEFSNSLGEIGEKIAKHYQDNDDEGGEDT